jgi:hypothetical protein
MDETAMLDSIFLPLADQYEAGNHHDVIIEPASPQEYEPLRELMAKLRSEGLIAKAHKISAYRFTDAGYAKFKPRIDALRAL